MGVTVQQSAVSTVSSSALKEFLKILIKKLKSESLERWLEPKSTIKNRQRKSCQNFPWLTVKDL